MKAFLSLLAILPLMECFSTGTVLINEAMSSNHHAYADGESDYADWVELLNTTGKALSLKGWSLTDDTAKTNAWVFPSIVMEPGSFLLVFLSGKNRKDPSELHSSFKLANGRETLYLIDQKGRMADHLPPGCIPVDRCRGRKPDGSEHWSVLECTPCRSNNQAPVVNFELKADTVLLGLPAGYYEGEQWLEIRNLQPTNQLYFTLDGTEPDEESMIYTGAIPLHELESDGERLSLIPTAGSWTEPKSLNTPFPVIRARALHQGCPASSTVTASYLMEGTAPRSCPVPVVSLVCDPKDLFDDETGIYVEGNHNNFSQRGKTWERGVHFSLFEPGGRLGIAMDAGMRIHGSGSRGAPQKSLRLYARSEYGPSSFLYPFFKGLSDQSSFKTILIRNVRDWSGTLFLEEMTHRLVRELEMESMAGQTVIVFINGEYWGIHSIRDRQDRSYLRARTHSKEAEFDIISHRRRDQPYAEEGNLLAYEELLCFLENEDLFREEEFSKICEQVDVNSLADYFIAEIYYANKDWPQNNYKMWREKVDCGKWRWMFYDCDGCLIHSQYDHLSEYLAPDGTMEQHEDWTIRVMRRLLSNKQFRDLFRSRFYDRLAHVFDPTSVLQEINQYESLYEGLVPAHVERWNMPNEILKWKHNVDKIKLFAIQRPADLVRQLEKNFGPSLLLYPNPGPGHLHIRFPHGGSRDVHLSIQSLCGQQLYSRIVTLDEDGSMELDLSSQLAPGIYFLGVNDGFFVFTEKYIQIR